VSYIKTLTLSPAAAADCKILKLFKQYYHHYRGEISIYYTKIYLKAGRILWMTGAESGLKMTA
jgi:hypothetical protein